ncbi:MAG TPA: DUF4389 domain-containing protein [Longimicrobiales bacterium]|nr:DUF4389 domain-containing protein [Longimicrobiales bacterium]
MNDGAFATGSSRPYPVRLELPIHTQDRNRITSAFRLLLALPHLILVGGPIAAGYSWSGGDDSGFRTGSNGGLLGIVALLVSIFAWFAILITGQHPRSLWGFSAFYLRWRVRAIAYVALLRDEYPPFGEGEYPAELYVTQPEGARDRLTVAFRLILALPHLIVVSLLGVAWFVTSVIAWFSIVLTGSYPAGLYRFGSGVMRWGMRTEAYLLLLRDEYPPFSLD